MPEKKTIALCLEYPLALRGGVSVVVETLLAGLKDRFRLVLVSSDTPETLKATRVASWIERHVPWRPESVSAETSRELARQIAATGAGLAHFHFGGNFGWGSRLVGRCPIPYLDRMGVPVISTVHSVPGILDGFCGPQKPLLFKLALLPFAWAGKMHVLKHLRREVAVSNHDADKLKKWYWPFAAKFRRIYHSRLEATTPQFVPASKRGPVILNVGHIAWRKGQLVLCEAFAQIAAPHPEWKLRLIGKMMEEPIEKKIRELIGKSDLAGRIIIEEEREDVRTPMTQSAIYVQPSFQEALGLALQEAMFSGCACIGSSVGGIPELIEDGRTGLLVGAGHPDHLAAALERLLTDSATREKLGYTGAASIVEKGMTAARMVENYLELYESILAGE